MIIATPEISSAQQVEWNAVYSRHQGDSRQEPRRKRIWGFSRLILSAELLRKSIEWK